MATSHRVASAVALLLPVLLGHVSGLQLLRLPGLGTSDLLEDALLVGLDGDSVLLKKRASEQGGAGMWFGPRLGRRDRRSADEIELDTDTAREEVVEMIKETPWALVPIKGGKRHTLNFTPRLGRDSSEEEEDDASTLMDQRSPPFAPRLGRRLVPFSPRLGRDQVYSPRLGRSLTPGATPAPAQNKLH